MDVSNIPVTAFTRDSIEETTFAKAINDLAEQQAIKATTRRCDECGKYQKHDDLKHVATSDGGTVRICPDCMDEKGNDGSGKTWKALRKAQWTEAVETLDEALDASPAWAWYQQLDSATKAQAFDRLAKANPLRQGRQQPAASRIVRLVKAELARRSIAETKAKRKKLKKQRVEMMRKSEAINARFDEAKAALAKALEDHAVRAAEAEAFTEDTSRRIDQMMKRLEIGRQAPLIAARAKQDQIRADYAYKAGQTTDPDLRAYYSALANGEDPDA